MITAALQPGQPVRIKRNDSGIPAGTIAKFIRIHEASGNPLVVHDGRPVALLADQLEPASAAPGPSPRLPGPAKPARPAAPAPLPPLFSKPKGPVVYSWTLLEPQQAFVTFSQRGIRVSERADRFLAGAPFVEVLYDLAQRAIGLRPVPEESEQTFPVGRDATETLVRVRQQLQQLLGSTAHNRSAIRYPVSWDGEAGILVITSVPFRKETG